MALEVEIKVLAAMKADIENKKYAEAALKGQTIRRSIEQKSARAGADALLVLAKGLTGKIDASRHDAVSKARLHALRNMAEYAIGVDRNKAEFYLNMVRGQINLPELPVRMTGYSHSMVAGGLVEMSYTTRLTPRTSLMIRLEMAARMS